MTKRLDPR
ncbi:hypothetical protein N499_0661A, partial [Wolbachia pipientis wVitA]